LVFEHTALKESRVKLKESGLIVQALKSLGQEQTTPEIIAKLRTWLPGSLRAKVLTDTTGFTAQFNKSLKGSANYRAWVARSSRY